MPRKQKPGEPRPAYEIRKDGAMWRVLDRRGLIQFSSMKRINCTDWVTAQGPTVNAQLDT